MNISAHIKEVESEDRGGYCLVGISHDFVITPKTGSSWSETQAYNAAKQLGIICPDVDGW